MLLPTSGGTARALLTIGKPETFQYGAFAWLPDSKALLVARTQRGNELSELWLVPTSGAPPKKIDFPLAKIRNLRLSPDGKTIAYHSPEQDLSELRALENFLP